MPASSDEKQTLRHWLSKLRDLRGEVTNTNVIVFGLTLLGLEPMTYGNRDEHANLCITDAVFHLRKPSKNNNKNLKCITLLYLL